MEDDLTSADPLLDDPGVDLGIILGPLGNGPG